VAITAPHAPAAPLRLNTVGLAFRATEPGRHAAELSRRIADAHGAELHGMTVIPVTPNLWIGPAAGGVQTLARIDGSLEDFARSDLRGLGGVIDHIAEGEPVHELRRFSETVDLLVVGTRSVGPLRRLLTGSTADELSTTAQCPLLVVGCSNDTAA
jgi:nucleotide-binding universal stress UspA family protein